VPALSLTLYLDFAHASEGDTVHDPSLDVT